MDPVIEAETSPVTLVDEAVSALACAMWMQANPLDSEGISVETIERAGRVVRAALEANLAQRDFIVLMDGSLPDSERLAKACRSISGSEEVRDSDIIQAGKVIRWLIQNR
jgi:hypothetical protein